MPNMNEELERMSKEIDDRQKEKAKTRSRAGETPEDFDLARY